MVAVRRLIFLHMAALLLISLLKRLLIHDGLQVEHFLELKSLIHLGLRVQRIVSLQRQLKNGRQFLEANVFESVLLAKNLRLILVVSFESLRAYVRAYAVFNGAMAHDVKWYAREDFFSNRRTFHVDTLNYIFVRSLE